MDTQIDRHTDRHTDTQTDMTENITYPHTWVVIMGIFDSAAKSTRYDGITVISK